MLIEFSVANFLSFKDKVTFSMVASNLKEHRENNVFTVDKFDLLKIAVIYGANASGKSNLFKAMKFMKNQIFSSFKETQVTEKIMGVERFKLSTETENKPSFFEIVFIHEEKRFRYGFLIDEERVHAEWLYYVPSLKEAMLFERENSNITIGNYYKEGKGLETKTRDNALFLSVVAQFNGEISKKILEWFKNVNIISGLDDSKIINFTFKKMEDYDYRIRILEFLKIADLGIQDIDNRTIEINYENFTKKIPEKVLKLLPKIKQFEIFTKHRKYNEKKDSFSFVDFDISEQESEGTKKIFALSAPIIDTIENGRILFIDEMDARLHPLITRFILGLFNSKDINTKNAQLIFITHDTTLLNKNYFRRDQIWFTEKNQYEATDLYSLVEYKIDNSKVRNDASYGKDYIQGKYGAVPFIGDFENLFEGK